MRIPVLIVAVTVGVFLTIPASATEQGVVGGAIVGGATGAVVGGPVGAVVGAGAGAVVGGRVTGHRYYHRSGYYRHYHHPYRY
jgi:hypothetical protein